MRRKKKSIETGIICALIIYSTLFRSLDNYCFVIFLYSGIIFVIPINYEIDSEFQRFFFLLQIQNTGENNRILLMKLYISIRDF